MSLSKKTAIQDLLGESTSLDHFSAKTWGKDVQYFPNAASPDLFSLEAFKSVLKMGAPYPCNSVRISTAQTPEDNNRSSLILAKDPSEAVRAIENGNSITINHLEYFLPASHPLNLLFAEICTLIGTGHDGLQIAAFYSPPSRRAFGKHLDRNNIFVMQVEGEKIWNVEMAPSVDTSFNLKPQDVLYLPYGIPHDVHAGDGNSLSLTFIMRAPTWRELVMEAVLNRLDASGNPNLNRPSPLPLGWLETIASGQLEDFIDQHVDTLNSTGVSPHEWRLAAGRLAMQNLPRMPVTDDPLKNTEILTELTLDDFLRAQWATPLVTVDMLESFSMASPGHPQVLGPPSLAPAIHFISSQRGRFRARDLPDSYEDVAKVAICRKLLRAGYLTMSPPVDEDME